MTGLVELELRNFRNCEKRTFDFAAPQILLTGHNGSGKSNLLEAIGYLSTLRSFRRANFRELLRINAKTGGFELRGVLNKPNRSPERLTVREYASGCRELYLGEHRCRRASDFILEFRTVIFSPDDRMLISAGSSVRRRFFDVLISSAEPDYLRALSNYARALSQRNAALKQHRAELAAAFEPELAAALEPISRHRRNYAEKMTEVVSRLLGDGYTFELIYRPSFSGSAADFQRKCAESREKELLRGFTLSGIQLDEFDVLLDGKNLRSFGSTGQIRLTALMLKLGEYLLLRQTELPVIVLADDVTGDLDAERCRLFFDTISDADQQFFTFARDPQFPQLAGAKRLTL